jgi:hypothetical protein
MNVSTRNCVHSSAGSTKDFDVCEQTWFDDIVDFNGTPDTKAFDVCEQTLFDDIGDTSHTPDIGFFVLNSVECQVDSLVWPPVLGDSDTVTVEDGYDDWY